MSKTYIIRMSDNSYDIVGPFADNRAAGIWGKNNQEQRNDDPRWQVLDLDDPQAQPTVITP